MATPTSTGQGQGLAQVFTGTRAADVFAYQKQLEEQRALQRAKEAEKAQQELSGKYDDLYKAELFETRDADWYYGQVQAIKDKYAGNMEALAKNNNPALTRQFQDDILKLRLNAKQSKAVKDELKKYREEMYTGPNAHLYPESEKEKFEKFISKESAGKMEVPVFKRLSGIDLDTEFTKQAYTPAAKMAVDMKTKDGYYEQELPSGKKIFVNSKSTTLPKEAAEEFWSLFLTKPENIIAINERFGDEAKATGKDPIQMAHDFYVPRLMINKKDLQASSSGGDEGGPKSFDPSYITALSKAPVIGGKHTFIDPSTGKERTGDIFMKKFSDEVKDAPFYPINYPVTVPTASGAIDWREGKQVDPNLLLSGTVSGYTVIPTKNNKISKSGPKSVYALVRTTDGYDIAVPVEQVANQGKQKGYDVENIVNGLYQSGKSVQMSAPSKKQIKVSEVANKAAAAGYTTEEYTQLLNQNGVQIIE